MKANILYGICTIVLLFGMSNVLALDNVSNSMTVRVNVIESSIGISVPDLIEFGDVASGYITERQDLDINNSGTVDINVVPELAADSADLFQHISFRSVLADPLYEIGNFSIEILKANSVGDIRTERIYMYLDLTNVLDVESGENIESDIVFWALPL